MNARDRIQEIAFSLATAGRLVEPPEVTAALDAYRAEVLREAQREVVAWLTKKAHEGTPVEFLASKVDRGAIRLFPDAAAERFAAYRAGQLAEQRHQYLDPAEPPHAFHAPEVTA